MLFEDDHSMLSLLQTLFSLEGFQVVSAEGELIEDLLLNIKDTMPDIILLDVNLRHNNGIDILSAIRANPIFDNIRVIMSSGMDYKHECLEKGAQGFIMKPYMPNDLIKIVRS